MTKFKIEEDKPVLVAGDPERLNMKKCDENHGISYHGNQVKYAVSIELNLKFLKIIILLWFVFIGKLGQRIENCATKIA